MHIELKRNEIALKRDESLLCGIKSHAKNSGYDGDSTFMRYFYGYSHFEKVRM